MPLVRPVAWSAVVVQVAVLASAVFVGGRILPGEGLLVGSCACLAYSLSVRPTVTRHHRAGIARVKRQDYDGAIACFARSLAFFDRHAWIDRGRALVLLSASGMCYREMALSNMGFCHGQAGRGTEARRCYETCLERFPGSGVAAAALRLMDAAAGAQDR